jgi:hypothetical protein
MNVGKHSATELHHQTHFSPILLCLFLEMRSCKLASNHKPPISASQVAKIADVRYWLHLLFTIPLFNFFGGGRGSTRV